MLLTIITVRQHPRRFSHPVLIILAVLRTVTGIALPLTFDTIMVLLTLRRLWSHLGEMHRLGQNSISQTILHDGS